MINLSNWWRFNKPSSEFVHTKLFDENTFYKKFKADLAHCRKEVIIESPFISSHRMHSLRLTFQQLVDRKIKVYVVTRHPEEHNLSMKLQAEEAIRLFETMGVQVLITTNYNHRKIAILDRNILWEGSLNILSQTCSQEIMRRIESSREAIEMFKFTRLGKYIY